MSFMVYPSMEPRSCKVLHICIPRRSSTEVSSPWTSSSHNRVLSSFATFGISGELIGLHVGTFTRTTKYMVVHDILPRNLMQFARSWHSCHFLPNPNTSQEGNTPSTQTSGWWVLPSLSSSKTVSHSEQSCTCEPYHAHHGSLVYGYHPLTSQVF